MERFWKSWKKFLFHENPILKEKLEKVKEKGHTRLTVYFIPHGYDKTLNFHVSIFTVGFFFLLIISIIALSIYGIYRSSYTKKELARLQSIYGAYFNNYMESRKYLDEVSNDYSYLEKNLKEIYMLFDGTDDELEALLAEKILREITKKEIREEEKKDKDLLEGRNYLKEVYELRYLRSSLEDRSKLLDATYSYFFNRWEVMRNIPIFNPLDNWNLTSGFGMRRSPTSGFFEFHDGIDLANATGTPIYASAPGKVIKLVYSNVGYGNYLVLEHEYGFRTLYAHCSKIFVKYGQTVEAGQKIAEVGTTGNVTGPHLHYEIWIGEGNKVDPEDYLNALNL